MKQMFHGKCTFSQSQTIDFLKFSGGAWIPCLSYPVASFCIFFTCNLRISFLLQLEFFQSVEYCIGTSSTTC